MDADSMYTMANLYLQYKFADCKKDVGFGNTYYDVVPSQCTEELTFLGLTGDDYIRELGESEHSPRDYDLVEYLSDKIELLDEPEVETFYNHFCPSLIADFDRGEMHGLAFKLELEGIQPEFVNTPHSMLENIRSKITFNTESLNKIMKKLGHEEFPESEKVSVKRYISGFNDEEVLSDPALEQIAQGIYIVAKQYFWDAGKDKLHAYSIVHGLFAIDTGRYQNIFVYVNFKNKSKFEIKPDLQKYKEFLGNIEPGNILEDVLNEETYEVEVNGHSINKIDDEWCNYFQLYESSALLDALKAQATELGINLSDLNFFLEEDKETANKIINAPRAWAIFDILDVLKEKKIIKDYQIFLRVYDGKLTKIPVTFDSFTPSRYSDEANQ